MFAAYFDAASATLDPSAFSSPAVFRLEIQGLFRRQWLFLGPERWAAEPNAYFLSSMGTLPILVWRGRDRLHLFVNRCIGSDQPLASGPHGLSHRLICSCHGWRYAPDAAKDAVVGEDVPRVHSIAGLVFGCFDPDVPDFETWIGDFGDYFQSILTSLPGGIEVVGDEPLSSRLHANWKFGAEAYSGDLYREMTLTRATRMACDTPASLCNTGFQAATSSGGIVLGHVPADPAAGQNALGGTQPVCATLFPNLSYDGHAHALHVWNPLEPESTEVRTYSLAGKTEGGEVQDARRRNCQLLFGPMGLETQDHEPVWASATAASRGIVARRHRLNLQMGLGRERRTNLPGLIADLGSESNQRCFYAWWQTEMERQPALARKWLKLGQPGGTGTTELPAPSGDIMKKD